MRVVSGFKRNRIRKVNVSATERMILETVEYSVESVDSQYILRVPKGFIFNGASIPKWAWSIVGHPFGENEGAALAHDYLYATQVVTRKESDIIYKKLSKKSRPVTWLQYMAIRMFGKSYWNAVSFEEKLRNKDLAEKEKVSPIFKWLRWNK